MKTKLTQSELGRLLGMTRQAIAHHVRAGKAPKNLSNVEGWRTYLAAVGRTGSAPQKLQGAIGRQRLAILKETRHSKARENRIQDGEVMEAAKVKRFITNLVGLFFAQIEKMVNDLPTVLKGKDELEIFEECTRRKLAITNTLKSKQREGVR